MGLRIENQGLARIGPHENLAETQTLHMHRAGQLVMQMHSDSNSSLAKRKSAHNIGFCWKLVDLNRYGHFGLAHSLTLMESVQALGCPWFVVYHGQSPLFATKVLGFNPTTSSLGA